MTETTIVLPPIHEDAQSFGLNSYQQPTKKNAAHNGNNSVGINETDLTTTGLRNDIIPLICFLTKTKSILIFNQFIMESF